MLKRNNIYWTCVQKVNLANANFLRQKGKRSKTQGPGVPSRWEREGGVQEVESRARVFIHRCIQSKELLACKNSIKISTEETSGTFVTGFLHLPCRILVRGDQPEGGSLSRLNPPPKPSKCAIVISETDLPVLIISPECTTAARVISLADQLPPTIM